MTIIVYRVPIFEPLQERTLFAVDASPVVVEFSDQMEVCEASTKDVDSTIDSSFDLEDEKLTISSEPEGEAPEEVDSSIQKEGFGQLLPVELLVELEERRVVIPIFIGPLQFPPPPVIVSSSNSVGLVLNDYSEPIGPKYTEPLLQPILKIEPPVANAPVIGSSHLEPEIEIAEVSVLPPSVEDLATKKANEEKLTFSLKLRSGLDTSIQSPFVEVLSNNIRIEISDLKVSKTESTNSVVTFSVKTNELPNSGVVEIKFTDHEMTDYFRATTDDILKAFEEAKQGKIPSVIYENGVLPLEGFPISFSVNNKVGNTSFNITENEANDNSGGESSSFSTSLGNFLQAASNFFSRIFGIV